MERAYEHTTRAVADLVPYAKNSRVHSDAQIAAIVASIREFGFTNPCLIDERENLIAGHGRVLAARRLGMKAVPCIVVDGLSETQRKALVIADNRLAERSEWDTDLLIQELGELAEDGFDLNLTGWTMQDLRKMGIGGTDLEAPSGFKEFGEDIATDHQCPSCGFRFSGGRTARARP